VIVYTNEANSTDCLMLDRNELDFFAIPKLKNSWNENFPVQIGRDGQVMKCAAKVTFSV